MTLIPAGVLGVPPPPGTSQWTAGEAATFNAWVIGGNQSIAEVQRRQIRAKNAAKLQLRQPKALPPAGGGADSRMPVAQGDVAAVTLDNRFLAKLAHRRQEIEAQQASHQTTAYVNRVHTAIRTPLDPKKSTQRVPGSESRPPTQQASARSPPPPAGRSVSPSDAARQLRQRLQQSFDQAKASQTFGSLFPPLLTPYSRPNIYTVRNDPFGPVSPRTLAQNAGADAAAGGAKGLKLTSPSTGAAPDVDFSATLPKDPFAVAAGPKPRPQPISGPKPFMPSASTSAPYRHFTNLNLLLKNAQQQQQLQQIAHQASPSSVPTGPVMSAQGVKPAVAPRGGALAAERPAAAGKAGPQPRAPACSSSPTASHKEPESVLSQPAAHVAPKAVMDPPHASSGTAAVSAEPDASS
mgnify:CR=1 FL=1